MPISSPVGSLSYLTGEMPGIGGVIKQRPEEFLVEEQPLYDLDGEGEHLYLFIEKCRRTTSDVVRLLAKAFYVRRSDIGYAGLKDKHAIARQHFSIYLPGGQDDQQLLDRIAYSGLTLLWARRHTNKLKRGHLSGNRFVIYIRDVKPTAVLQTKKVMDRLIALGMPNFIGPQRFGYRQNNDSLGRLLLLGEWQEFLDRMLGDPEGAASTRIGREAYERGDYFAALEAWPRHLRYDRQALDALRQGKSKHESAMHIDEQQREFLICGLQSAIFNQVLDYRLRHGSFGRLLAGDLAWIHRNRAVFTVDAATAELEAGPRGRLRTGEISPSGPMWGAKMSRASGEVAKWELQAMADQKLTEADFARNSHVVGRRRPLRIFLKDPEVSGGVDEHGPYVRLALELPRGTFATTILREVMKTDDGQAYQGVP